MRGTRLRGLRVAFNLASATRLSERGHEFTPKHAGQGLPRKQIVGLARRCGPSTVLVQHPKSHHHMNMQVQQQILRPGMSTKTPR